MSSRLVSGNVGLPRKHSWKGRTVRTGIWKDPIAGRRMAATAALSPLPLGRASRGSDFLQVLLGAGCLGDARQSETSPPLCSREPLTAATLEIGRASCRESV